MALEKEHESRRKDSMIDEDKSVKDGGSGNVLLIKIDSSFTQIGKDGCIIFRRKGPELSAIADGELFSTPGGKHTSTLSIESCSQESSESTPDTEPNHKKKNSSTRRRKTHKTNKGIVDIVTVHKSIAPTSPSASCTELYKVSDDVMTQLQVVRDNGRWDAFEDIVITLSQKYESHEAQIVIMLERSMAACYNNRLEESMGMIKTAIDLASCTENSSILIGRAHYYKSAVYRRQKKTGKAIECVETAAQIFDNNELAMDSCCLTYERASALMDFILQCSSPKPALLEKVKHFLLRSIDECIAFREDSTRQRYMKTDHYGFIKMAMLLLDCRTAPGRKRTVSEENIKDAKKCLDTLKERYWDKTSLGEKIQYFLCQADLNFRLKIYQMAEFYALKARNTSIKFGFNTEIKPAQDRLDEIRMCWALQSQEKAEHDLSADGCETSDGCHGDISSSSDSDWLNSLSFL